MMKRTVGGLLFVSMMLAGYSGLGTEVSAPSYIEPGLVASAEETTSSPEVKHAFEDFVGYYGQFSVEDSSEVETLLTISETTIKVGWWMSEYEEMEIIDKTIEGDTLIIDYYQKADGAYVLQDVWGTVEVTLHESGVFIDGGEPFYSLTEQEVQDYGFTLQGVNEL